MLGQARVRNRNAAGCDSPAYTQATDGFQTDDYIASCTRSTSISPAYPTPPSAAFQATGSLGVPRASDTDIFAAALRLLH